MHEQIACFLASSQRREIGFAASAGSSFLEGKRRFPRLAGMRVDVILESYLYPSIGERFGRRRKILGERHGRKPYRRHLASAVLDAFLGWFESGNPAHACECRPVVSLVKKTFGIENDLVCVPILPVGDFFEEAHVTLVCREIIGRGVVGFGCGCRIGFRGISWRQAAKRSRAVDDRSSGPGASECLRLWRGRRLAR